MSTLLLLMILVVSVANLLVVAAYFAHELGWFPHGKPRHLPTVSFTRCELPVALRGLRLAAGPRGLRRPHPLADELRRVGHSEVYGAADVPAELTRLIAHCRAHPEDWSRRDDLLGVANVLAARPERSPQEAQLLEEAVAVLVAAEEPAAGRAAQ
jgi:hypothetical protein